MVAAASICNAQSEPQQALAYAEAARAIFTELGDQRGVAEALRRIAPFYLFEALAAEPPNTSIIARAEAIWEEELALRRTLDDRLGLAWAERNLGVAALHRGDAAHATMWFEACLPHLEALADRDGVAVTLIDLGRSAAQQADIARAAQLFTRAFAALQDLGDQRNTVHLLEDVAHLALRTGQAGQAAHLLCAVDALRAAKGHGLLTIHRTRHGQGRDAARHDLGEAFATACETGRGLTLDQAMALALASLAAVTAQPVTPAQPTPAQDLGLTQREMEVLRLLARGMSDREIAGALFLSPRTVGWHVTHLLTKLDVSSRTAAAAAALRRGLIS
jgi:DNA-binding CsgD family transcriptional regulator